MAGGEGSRLGAGEKPLHEVDGTPMVDRVLAALYDSAIEDVTVVTSPNTPKTAAHVDVPTLHTAGDGYVADLGVALETVDRPVLTVTADLPLLSGSLVDQVLREAGTDSTTVFVPFDLPLALGATVDRTTEVGTTLVAPTGLNVVGHTDDSTPLIMHDQRLAVNVNRPRDARVAEVLA